jgi:hypothetical protein
MKRGTIDRLGNRRLEIVSSVEDALSAIFLSKYLIYLNFSEDIFQPHIRPHTVALVGAWQTRGCAHPSTVRGLIPSQFAFICLQQYSFTPAHDVLSGKRQTAARTSWRNNPHPLISASSHFAQTTTTRLFGRSGPKTSASQSHLRHPVLSWSKTRRSKAAALKQHLSLMQQRSVRAMASRAASIRKPNLHHPACPGTGPLWPPDINRPGQSR